MPAKSSKIIARNMLVVGLYAALLIVHASCSRTLSRGKALDLIAADSYFPTFKRRIDILVGRYCRAYSSAVDAVATSSEPFERAGLVTTQRADECIIVTLTKRGEQYRNEWEEKERLDFGNNDYTTVSVPVQRREPVAITGIVEEEPNRAAAEFTYQWL